MRFHLGLDRLFCVVSNAHLGMMGYVSFLCFSMRLSLRRGMSMIWRIWREVFLWNYRGSLNISVCVDAVVQGKIPILHVSCSCSF